jgi:hypothetical protein
VSKWKGEAALLELSRRSLVKLAIEKAARLSEELGVLTRHQHEALRLSPYLRMSKKEAGAYEERRLRIEEISLVLMDFKKQTP